MKISINVDAMLHKFLLRIAHENNTILNSIIIKKLYESLKTDIDFNKIQTIHNMLLYKNLINELEYKEDNNLPF
jgi:hypothetical protein